MNKALPALLAILGACGDGSETASAAVPQNNLQSTPAGIFFWWNGATAGYPTQAEVSFDLDRVLGEWINEGAARPEPLKIHFAHVTKVKAYQISLVPASFAAGTMPYLIVGSLIHVAMDGSWQHPSTGVFYVGVERVKLAWELVCGFSL